MAHTCSECPFDGHCNIQLLVHMLCRADVFAPQERYLDDLLLLSTGFVHSGGRHPTDLLFLSPEMSKVHCSEDHSMLVDDPEDVRL